MSVKIRYLIYLAALGGSAGSACSDDPKTYQITVNTVSGSPPMSCNPVSTGCELMFTPSNVVFRETATGGRTELDAKGRDEGREIPRTTILLYERTGSVAGRWRCGSAVARPEPIANRSVGFGTTDATGTGAQDGSPALIRTSRPLPGV
jgi:hypothetical protein